MTKLDWDRVRRAVQTRRYGTDRDVFRADGKMMLISVAPAKASRSEHQTPKPEPMRGKATQEDRELMYLHDVIRSELTGNSIPKLPKAIRGTLGPKIRLKGGPLNWAKSHQQYENIRERKLKKLNKQNIELAVHPTPNSSELEILSIQAEITLRQQLITEAQMTMAKIDTMLAQLREKLKMLKIGRI
jgi:hypothetical protein